jgi:hypothetical protein
MVRCRDLIKQMQAFTVVTLSPTIAIGLADYPNIEVICREENCLNIYWLPGE